MTIPLLEKPRFQNRFYLMRHGESLANKRGLIVSRPHNAVDDYGITARGAEQVMGAASATRLDTKTIIVSSDYLRCSETADIMHGVLACTQTVEFDVSLRERDFGDFELQDTKHYADVWEHDLQSPSTSLRGVETVYDVLRRAVNCIHRIDQRYRDQAILLVSHGDLIQILITWAQGLDSRLHRSIAGVANADIRRLDQLRLPTKSLENADEISSEMLVDQQNSDDLESSLSGSYNDAA